MSIDNTKISFITTKRYERLNLRGNVSITANGLGNAKTITHNLGYVPFYRFFLKYPGRTFYEPLVQSPVDQGGYFDYEVKTGIIDTTRITVYYLNNTVNSDPTIIVYYRIYAESQS